MANRKYTHIKCAVNECSGNANNSAGSRRGLCCAHRKKLAKYGDPLFKKTRSNGELLQLLQKMIANPANNKCVLWIGKGDYGQRVTFNSNKLFAARVALIIHSGEDRIGFIACHGPCHNRKCINPLHLSWGRRSKNNGEDRRRDGTSYSGEKHWNHRLTDKDVHAIRSDPRIHRVIASEYKIHANYVSKIKLRKAWSWLK